MKLIVLLAVSLLAFGCIEQTTSKQATSADSGYAPQPIITQAPDSMQPASVSTSEADVFTDSAVQEGEELQTLSDSVDVGDIGYSDLDYLD